MLMENDIITQPLDSTDEMLIDEVKRLTYVRAHSQEKQSEYICLETFTKDKTTRMDWRESYLSVGKEELYLRLVRNLYRRMDFIELTQALEAGDISEEQFDAELDNNEDRYLIPASSETPSVQQLIQASDIVKKIGRVDRMTIDEASEMFSLDMDRGRKILAGSSSPAVALAR